MRWSGTHLSLQTKTYCHVNYIIIDVYCWLNERPLRFRTHHIQHNLIDQPESISTNSCIILVWPSAHHAVKHGAYNKFNEMQRTDYILRHCCRHRRRPVCVSFSPIVCRFVSISNCRNIYIAMNKNSFNIQTIVCVDMRPGMCQLSENVLHRTARCPSHSMLRNAWTGRKPHNIMRKTRVCLQLKNLHRARMHTHK